MLSGPPFTGHGTFCTVFCEIATSQAKVIAVKTERTPWMVARMDACGIDRIQARRHDASRPRDSEPGSRQYFQNPRGMDAPPPNRADQPDSDHRRRRPTPCRAPCRRRARVRAATHRDAPEDVALSIFLRRGSPGAHGEVGWGVSPARERAR